MPYCEPRGYSYYGESALEHTRKQVDAMRAMGIKVLSYFIGGGQDYGSTQSDFSKMYGKSGKSINVTKLIPLAKTLNQMFLTK